MHAASEPRVCLTIAGLDPSGGAGVVADIKTFSAFGCYGAAVVTSITFQDTTGVFGAVHQDAATVRGQLEPVFADLEIDSVKTGMLPTAEVVREIASSLKQAGIKNIVVDPVVRSTSGFDLIDDLALAALVDELFPLASLVTPNIPEAERISGIVIKDARSIEEAARIMQVKGARKVLIKGGHLERDKYSTDYLFSDNELTRFEAERIETTATHGTGCTLSSAIAANLALGHDLKEAVRISKEFVTEAIRAAPKIGKGHSPINHFVRHR